MAIASTLHGHTPRLQAQDARGLVVRQVSYWRASATQAAQARIALSHHDLVGQLQTRWDPRRAAGAPGAAASQRVLASLSGLAVLDDSADAGWRLFLSGDAGQALEHWDGRGGHWQTEYDERLRPRLVRERIAGQPPRLAERFTYATDAGLNRRGRLARHDDEAGSRLIDAYSLTGQVRSETRHFLAALDLPDWPEDPDALLEPGPGATSASCHGPLGDVLEQTDALGNRQAFRFNPSGELAGVNLTLHDGSQHPLLVEARYNAFGQVESQTAGNGVTSQADYNPATGRLRSLSASRPGRALLQDLHYEYDAVGNVTSIEDRSQPVSHFANQRVEPLSTFVYDSLYQLIEASGREAAGASIGPGLPDLAPDPGDTSRLLNYQQFYTYDASGNLLTLRHVGQQPYTREMAVAKDSNRAVPAPGDPLTAFDVNGNLLDLDAGQPLQWNARNQLHGTRQVARPDGEDDQEHYRYGSDGLRVRKVSTRLVAGRMQPSETRYLPGLELHTRPGESWAVITTQAGRCVVRCLQWSEGQPEGIANPQMRYSLDDLHDSSGLELDGSANIISHEGYYPFGGTAWWAAHSAIEASYKTHRYSGKERDGSGLCYYGLRYYAPWLMRWINPDPAGDVDGLNRYRFVRNNPLTLGDPNGLNPVEQHYSIQRFSQAAKAPGSPLITEQLSQLGVSLRQNLGKVANFAYDTHWTVKDYLHLGAANQGGDIKRSQYQAMVAGSLMRQVLGDSDRSWRDHAEHALAAGAGFCDEFGFSSAMLMSSSSDWPNVPVYLVSQPDHRSAILGDPRQADPLVVDPWVALPVVHLWSASLNSKGNPPLTDFTPRMPGDPQHAIDRQTVEGLRQRHFSNIPTFPEQYMQTVLNDSILNGFTYAQITSMAAPHEVFYRLDGNPYSAAAIPASLYEATFQALAHAVDLNTDPRFSALLRGL